MLHDDINLDVDDLDLQDREYMDIVRGLARVDIAKFLEQYLKVSDPKLYDNFSDYFKYKR